MAYALQPRAFGFIDFIDTMVPWSHVVHILKQFEHLITCIYVRASDYLI